MVNHCSFLFFSKQHSSAYKLQNRISDAIIRIYPQDTKSLEEFLKDYPEVTVLLLYRGEERIKQGNVLCIPCEDFLRHLQPGQALI